MEKSGKGKKIFAGLVVGVLATTAIVCAAVPQVRNKIGDLINEIKNKFKSEEEKNNDRKEQIHDDDHYQNLDEDEMRDFDDKFDQIVDSDEYKKLDDDQKDDLIDKFVESEKLQKEIEKEQVEQETRKEEVKEELGRVSESLKDVLEKEDSTVQEVQQEISNTKNELNEIINSETSSSEEIAAAQEKLEKVEKAEQEYVYYETSSAIKNQTASNQKNDISSSMTLRKINGIYNDAGVMIIEGVFIQKDVVCGVEFFSEVIAFVTYSPNSGMVVSDMSYSEIVEYVNNNVGLIGFLASCSNVKDFERAKEREQYFQENKYSMHNAIQVDENRGRNFSIIKSWDRIGENDTMDAEHPIYLLRETRADGSIIGDLYLIYNGSSYIIYNAEKICPEFWAQVEAEQNKQSEQAQAEASVEQYATRNEAGEMKSFDYTAFRQAEETKAKQKTPVETKQSNVLYDDLDFSL